MEFLDKLRTSLSSPLRSFNNQPTENCSIKTWSLPVANFSSSNIRLLLFRDCDRRGRKCLYDSQHVIRDKNGKFTYIATGVNSSEMKDVSEYIFGCVRLMDSDKSKRFHKFNGKYVWSQSFCPKPNSCNNSSSSNLSSTPIPPTEKSTALGFPSVMTPLSRSPVSTCSVGSSPGPPKLGTITSLPTIGPLNPSNLEKSFSLPSNIQMQQQDPQPKTHLGLVIMIETTTENVDAVGPYVQSMSAMMEECSSWFSDVASKAYRCPSTFVQTLYDFTIQLKNLLHSRLSSPLVSPMSLAPNWKSLPVLTSELTQLILEHDERHCRLKERIKLVLIGGAKKIGEGLLYLFKILLLQCNRSTDMDFGIDATTFCKDSPPCSSKNTNPTKADQAHCHAQPPLKSQPFSNDSSYVSMSSSAGLSMSSTAASISCDSESSPPSPPIYETPTLINKISFKITTPKIENERLHKREYDSGVELESESSCTNLAPAGGVGGMVKSLSMKRSVSQKFDSGCGSSSDENGWRAGAYAGRRSSKGNLLYPQPYSHEFEEVSFHLHLGYPEQSINTLALSEPNLDKLKINHGSPAFMEAVEHNTKIEKLPTDPMKVKLNFERELSTKPLTSYCPYCDSIGIVPKFSPLYYIQWIKTTCCNTGLSEENFNLMKTFSSSKFIVVNLDKSLIRTINFDPSESCRTKNLPTSCNSNDSTSLVSNLIHNLQHLATNNENREAEIEHFLRVQLDFVKKIAHEFGESWSLTEDACLKKKYSYLSLSDTDLKLIYSLAKMKFPSLAQGE